MTCKEVLLFASVLDALKTEGDVAYCDTLLHNLVNDIATHIDSIMSANNLVYIIDMFFMVSHIPYPVLDWCGAQSSIS